MAVFNQGIDYLQKVDAMGLPKRRIKLNPSNQNTFTAGSGNIQFNLPMSQPGKFANLKDAYIVCDITNNDATDNNFIGNCGSPAFIKKLTVETDSAKFSELDNWNVLWGMHVDEKAGIDYLKSQGDVLFGMKQTRIAGESIADGATTRKIIPLAFTGVAGVQYYPMHSRDNLRVQIDLESAILAIVAGTDGLTSEQFSISNCQMFYDVYTMEKEDYSKFLSDIGGIYRISTTDWMHHPETIATADTSLIANLGSAKRKVKNLYACVRNSLNLTDDQANSLTARNKSGITSYRLLLDGETVMSNEVNTSSSSASETMAEIMKANGGLLNLEPTTLSNLAGGDDVVDFNFAGHADASTTNALSGSYFMKLNFENGFQGNFSVSGLDIVSGKSQFQIEKGEGTSANERIDIFVEYCSEYVMDVNEGTWQKFS
tara:strand:+ start:1511 stop:2797 length:1287 start_codon:yes stop_codon:yes gene_type:complete